MHAEPMMDEPRRPAVSVVIPTFRRPDLLRRAVESVFAQSFPDWELVISDDEADPGDTWTYLEGLTRKDNRVRAVRNHGRHGQVGNINNVLLAARGEWVKPLYDDDVLQPECLRRLLEAVAQHTSVALVTCLAQRFEHGRPLRAPAGARQPRIERLPQRLVHLAMYLQDANCGIPTQVMVHRSAIEKGALFEEVPGLFSGVDSWWYARILQHGDLLFLHEVLVEQHQGEHDSVSRQVSRDPKALDREFELLRELQLPLIDPALRPPPLPVARQMLRIIRAFNCIRQRQPAGALERFAGAWHPRAWSLAGRWLLSQRFPHRYHAVPRLPVQL